MISETKLDDTFPLHQFTIDGYSKQIRLDINCYGGGLIFFIRDDLPCKVFHHSLPKDVEGIFQNSLATEKGLSEVHQEEGPCNNKINKI